MSYCFKQTCDWIKSKTENHAVAQFRGKMREFACIDSSDDNVDSTRYIKKILKDNYQENVIICSKQPGGDDRNFFHDIASYLINQKYKDENNSTENKVRRTLLTAANIIKDKNRGKNFNNDVYSTPDDISYSSQRQRIDTGRFRRTSSCFDSNSVKSHKYWSVLYRLA